MFIISTILAKSIQIKEKLKMGKKDNETKR